MNELVFTTSSEAPIKLTKRWIKENLLDVYWTKHGIFVQLSFLRFWDGDTRRVVRFHSGQGRHFLVEKWGYRSWKFVTAVKK